jgi:broad specificity phosphatase PhoE
LRLASRLSQAGLNAVYSSTARAAVETANLVSATSDLSLVRVPELADLSVYPVPTNGSGGDLTKLQAEHCMRFINRPRWDTLRGVERTKQFRHRVIQAIEAIVARHPAQRVAIVTHPPVINAYLSMVLGIERDMFFQPEFTSISSVRILRDLYSLRTINDRAHLMSDFDTESVPGTGEEAHDTVIAR